MSQCDKVANKKSRATNICDLLPTELRLPAIVEVIQEVWKRYKKCSHI